MEMTILQECDSLPEQKRKHFIKMIDRGEIIAIIIYLNQLRYLLMNYAVSFFSYEYQRIALEGNIL